MSVKVKDLIEKVRLRIVYGSDDLQDPAAKYPMSKSPFLRGHQWSL